jgi:hypothetical protein
MSAPDLETILAAGIPVKLIVNPLNLSAADLGGSQLGQVKDVVVKSAQAYGALVTEALGHQTVDAIDLGAAYVVSCCFRSFDDDAVTTFFPGATTGLSSGKKYVKYPLTPATSNSWKEGNLLSARSVKVAILPEDSDHHQMGILYRALPLVAERNEEWYAHGKAHEWFGDFLAIQDAQGRMYVKGLKEDLSL